LSHLVILSTLDVQGRRNNREHHAIKAFRDRFDRLTVVFRRRGRGGAGSLLRSQVEIDRRDGVAYVGIDPPLNPPEGTVRNLTREGAHGGSARRWLGVGLDTLAIGRDALTIRALASAARPHLRHGEEALCEAFGPWAAAAALKLRREGLVGAVAYIDRDYEPGFMNSVLRRRWAVRMERRAAAAADLTFSISARLADRFQDVRGARVCLTPTGVDARFFTPIARTTPSPHLIFVGQVAPWSGIDEALDALALLRSDRPDARLSVLGPVEPAFAAYLKERISGLGIADMLEWRGERPRPEVAGALAVAGIGLAAFRPHPLRIYAAPLKILEYLASGLPVIALAGSAGGDLIKDTDTGITCQSSGAGIAQAVRRLLSEPEAYLRFSAAGPGVAAAHDWDLILRREFEILQSLRRAPCEGCSQ
jgi:glycosyltransferase involved in cell wall biosynthesis